MLVKYTTQYKSKQSINIYIDIAVAFKQVWFIMFNATFNNISVILLKSKRKPLNWIKDMFVQFYLKQYFHH